MTASDEYQDHLKSYKGFTKFAVYTTALVVVTLVLMALFLL